MKRSSTARPTFGRLWLCVGFAVLLSVGSGWASAQSAALPIPRLRVPKLATPPVLDGKLAPGEWDGAAALTGFMNFTGQLMLPHDLQPVWWIGYDDKNLYLAQRYPLYPKGTIKATAKFGDRGGIAQDTNSMLWDDHVEIEISDLPERSMPNKNYFYKILTNPYGALVDHRMEWSVGWSGFEWESAATVKCDLTDDFWTFEMAIPFKSLGHAQAPADGTRWFMQLVSAGDPGSYYFAWQPVAWTEWDFFPEIVFDSKAPVVRVESLGQPMNGKLDVAVGLRGAAASVPVTVSAVVSDSAGAKLYEESRTWEAAPGKSETLHFVKDLDLKEIPGFQWGQSLGRTGSGAYTLNLKAATGDGRVLYEASPVFIKTPATLKERLYDLIASSRGGAGAPVLNSVYYHTAQLLEATVDTAIIRAKPEVRQAREFRARILAQPSGKVMVDATAFIQPDGQGRLLAGVPALPDGEYIAETTIPGPDGKPLAEKKDPFTVRQYAWEQSPAGKEKIVIAPFTPVETAERTLRVWGRTYTYADTGLPTSVVSKGRELLAAPATLSGMVNGRHETLAGKGWPQWGEKSGHNATLHSVGHIGPVAVDVTVDTEYDGTMLYTLTLAPTAPARLDALDLTLPLAGMTGYQVVRSGRDLVLGEPPAKDGVFWDSARLSATPNILGTFLPFAILGDGERAFLWCADSDQGWMLDDHKASFFLERAGVAVTMRASFCNTPFNLRTPRTIRFMLQALPAKPLPVDYRWRAWEGYAGNAPTTGALSCFWAYGTGPCVSFYKPEHYQVFKDVIDKEKQEARRAQERFTGPKFEPLSRWYVATNTTGRAMTEYDTYSGEWLGTTYKKPEPESHYIGHKSPWGEYDTPVKQCRAYADLVQTTVDCRVYAMDQHQKQCGLNGYWWDHDRFWSSGSVIKGTGYVRDDGQVQGIFNLSLSRQMMKRMATCAEVNGIRPWHGYYAPNNIGIISAFMQYNWAVESWVYMTAANNDLMDNVQTLERYKMLAGRYTGNPTIMTTATMETPWQNGDTKRYPFQSRSVHGMALLLDVGVSEGRSRQEEWNRLVQCLREFDYFNAAVEWTPWWRSRELVRLDGAPQAVCTVYTRNLPGVPRAAMLVVFNAGDKDATVTVTPAESALLGKPATKLTDVEQKTALGRAGSGWGPINLKRHDYALLVLE